MRRAVDIGLLIVTVGLIGTGGYLGLFRAPPEAMMGDVYRILYVHVPSAWMALLCYTLCFGSSLWFLLRQAPKADALAEAAAEVGVLFNTILLVTGSIWARPTWGTWWTWDPRLTTAAIMWLAFIGYLALRRFVDAPERRAMWSAVVGIIIYVDIPIVWFSVKWWNTLHQLQSSPSTVDSPMVLALRVSAFGFLAALVWLVRLRYRLALLRQREELTLPPPEVVSA